MSKPMYLAAGGIQAALGTNIDNIIADLDNLRFDFIDLYTDLLNNPRLCDELQSLQQELPPRGFRTISPTFNQYILTQFGMLLQHYVDLKNQIMLENYITQEEIESIEESTCARLAADDPELKRLMFFPELQAIHVDQIYRYKQELSDQCNELRNQMTYLHNDYHDRVEYYYVNAYILSGLFSICVVGLPLLIVTAVLHVIDKVTTFLKTSRIAAEVKKKEIEIGKDINPYVSLLNNSIIQNPANHIRQSFFFAKCRNMQTMTEIEHVAHSAHKCKS